MSDQWWIERARDWRRSPTLFRLLLFISVSQLSALTEIIHSKVRSAMSVEMSINHLWRWLRVQGVQRWARRPLTGDLGVSGSATWIAAGGCSNYFKRLSTTRCWNDSDSDLYYVLHEFNKSHAKYNISLNYFKTPRRMISDLNLCSTRQ